jgi:DNA-binding MarR family transcriptional regulator
VDDLRHLLVRAARTASRHYRARVSQLDLTAGQATALLFLADLPGAALGTLAAGLDTDLATTSTMIDRLMSAELVRRETDPADRRRALLYATDKAMALISQLEDARRETAVYLRDALGPERTQQLTTLLDDLIGQLNKATEGGESKVAPV